MTVDEGSLASELASKVSTIPPGDMAEMVSALLSLHLLRDASGSCVPDVAEGVSLGMEQSGSEELKLSPEDIAPFRERLVELLGLDSGSRFADARTGLVERLGRRFEFSDHTAVEKFLRENPFLTGLLLDAHKKIQEHFGSNTRAALKVVKAPEAEEDKRLFVFIQTGLSPKEALAYLARLDQGWWLDALSQARGKMSIDVEYV